MRCMPMFDFECSKCGHAFEDIIPSDAACPPCPQCTAPTEKVLSIGLGKVKKLSKKGEYFLNKDTQAKLRAENKAKGINVKY